MSVCTHTVSTGTVHSLQYKNIDYRMVSFFVCLGIFLGTLIMADVLSKRNRFKVNRVNSAGGNSEEDGDDSEVFSANRHYLPSLFCRWLLYYIEYYTCGWMSGYYLQKGNSSEAIELGERPGSSASNDGERASSPTALLSQTNTYMTMNDGGQRTYAATKSLRHQLTREALPRLDNYRNILSIQAGHRPTLDELHNATIHEKVKEKLSWQ